MREITVVAVQFLEQARAIQVYKVVHDPFCEVVDLKGLEPLGEILNHPLRVDLLVHAVRCCHAFPRGMTLPRLSELSQDWP